MKHGITSLLAIGQRMEDGTVYAGISPDTGKPMYALPGDAPLTMKWKQAMEYAAAFEGHGHPQGTFRVPTKDELNVLFQNEAQIGGFKTTGSAPARYYWSSSACYWSPTKTETHPLAHYAWNQSFYDGRPFWNNKNNESALRLVRS